MMRLPQIVLLVTFTGFCWLGMQAVHELGHITAALLTGGEVIKVVLHPLTISRTDLGLNPHPLAVVWAGPLVGTLLPLFAFGLARWSRIEEAYLFRFFAGFCLVANGLYIGIGRFLEEGADPWVMTENGSPRWLLVAFGAVTFPIGLYLWHRQGRNFGLRESRGRVSIRATVISAILFFAFVGVELLWNAR